MQIGEGRGINMARIKRAMVVALIIAVTLSLGPIPILSAQQQPAQAQTPAPSADPTTILTDLLATACRQDTAKFPDYLTASNAASYRKLAANQQVALLRRLVLMQDAGRPLLSTTATGRTVLRCESPGYTGEVQLGTPRIDQNLAFVPVDVKPDRNIEFGLVRNTDGWKLISLGVLMLDFSQLAPEWAAATAEDREAGIIAALRKISSAVETYRNAFEKLPDTLAQLGPAPKEGISPDAAGLLDATLVSGHASGYAIRYVVLPTGPDGKDTQFELAATPDEYGKSGRRSFFLNQSGKLRGGDKKGAPATAADPVIEDSPSPN